MRKPTILIIEDDAFNSLSNLPGKNIANREIVRDQIWIGIVIFCW